MAPSHGPETPFGFIYRVTNRVNGRVYVGQTTKPVSIRWSVHKSEAGRRPACRFHKAIVKHGESAFHVEAVDVALDIEELNALEEWWIASERSHEPEHGYNLTLGGFNAVRTEQALRNASIAHRGKVASPETRAKMSAVRIGRKQSAEHRANRSRVQKGIRPSAACLAAVSEANRRRTFSPETRAKLSLAAQKANRVRWGK